MDEPKFCRDCKWNRPETTTNEARHIGQNDLCTHEESVRAYTYYAVVGPTLAQPAKCFDMRLSGACGPSANRWEPKP